MLDLSRMPQEFLALNLAELHRETEVGESLELLLPSTLSDLERVDLLTGAGFVATDDSSTGLPVERQWTLADTVGPNMAVLIVGLNPSPSSADNGVGFARPGNRFWPAVLAAGLATIDRDPVAALKDHGMGMTDVVKRTTRKASEVHADEFRTGLARVTRLIERTTPNVVAFVGLAGWRTAMNRTAVSGWQAETLGGRPVYLLPSTSGLNASSQLPDFIDHFTAIRHPPTSPTHL